MRTLSLKYVTFILIAAMAMAGCNKNKVEPSKITYWPTITLNGDAVMTIIAGDPFTDPGGVATEGGNPSTLAVDNPVDPNTPGVYTITYTATNVDGIAISDSRTVIVLPGAVTNDVNYIEGDYETSPQSASNALANTTTIEKVAPGVYHTGNCWGSGSSVIIPAYFFCLDGVTLEIPDQNSGTFEVFTPAPGAYDPLAGTIDWTVNRINFQPGGLIVAKHWQKL